MKKIVLMLALMIATMTVAANNILYFSYNQAARTVACLNSQDELMIYCGYEDELPTYVLINEVWAEQISSSFYEIWLYGYDAYTGEEIYMPIDLECIYLVQHGNIYSAAQYLRFKNTHRRPTFAWAMPPYNPFVRAPRPVIYYYTYHYDIHRPGWHYYDYPAMHYHPYYMRPPHVPAPIPPRPYTPGHDRPGYNVNPNGGYNYTGQPLLGNITASRSKIAVQNDPTQRSGNRITSNRTDNTITTTDRASGKRTVSEAPSRTGETSSRSGVSSDNSRSSSSRSGVGSDNSRSSSSRSGVSSDNSRSSSSREANTTSSRNSNSNTPSTNKSSNISSSSSTPSSSSSREKASSSTSRSSATPSSSSNTSSREKASSSTSRSSATPSSSSSTSSREKASSSTSRNSKSSSNTSRGTSTRGK